MPLHQQLSLFKTQGKVYQFTRQCWMLINGTCTLARGGRAARVHVWCMCFMLSLNVARCLWVLLLGPRLCLLTLAGGGVWPPSYFKAAAVPALPGLLLCSASAFLRSTAALNALAALILALIASNCTHQHNYTQRSSRVGARSAASHRDNECLPAGLHKLGCDKCACLPVLQPVAVRA